MGFSYLNGKNWADITREERFFCAELYSVVKGKEGEFVKFLNSKAKLGLPEKDLDAEWECGFEVCFYRDFAHESKAPNEYSPKRTFDLCLFSEKVILIIEAKVYMGFRTRQNTSFKEDLMQVKRMIKKTGMRVPETVKLIALCSEKYWKNTRLQGDFDAHISWSAIDSKYPNKSFKRAEELGSKGVKH